VITSPVYRITRDGFVFLAMGFTDATAARLSVDFPLRAISS
jgi:phage regulator Rha-like protein